MEQPGKPKDKILIVDDNATNVEILEEILHDEYVLETAGSGEEALEKAGHFYPSLILLDIMMPGIDGYETCRRIRMNPSLRHAKIIMVSAKAMVSERLDGYAAGADDYITKPFVEDELLAKVRVYIRLRSVEEIDQLKTSMLGLLSHETRTPMNGILPPLELVIADEDLDAQERKTWLQTAYDSAVRLQALFEKVMMLCEMKSGQWAFELHEADVSAVVQRVVETFRSRAAERGVQIEYQCEGPVTVEMDVDHFDFVIEAMLDNAIRFGPEGQPVQVTVQHADRHCDIRVTDQGEGPSADLVPHLFDEFHSSDIEHHSEGHGLSLAIARQIVLHHNGALAFDRHEGSGTTFFVRLPDASLALRGAVRPAVRA